MCDSVASCLRFLQRAAEPRESDSRLLAEILVIFPPTALTQANGFVILDEFDRADILHHGESKLRFNAQAERRSVNNRKRLAIHLIGKNRLWILRQLQANRTVEVPRSLGVRLRCGFIVGRVENDVAGGGKWTAQSEYVMAEVRRPTLQRPTSPGCNSAW